MRRLLSLLLVLLVVSAAGVAQAQGVPGVEIIDDDRVKITGMGTFYICGDADVYSRLQSLPGAEDPEAAIGAVSQAVATGGAANEKAEAASAYAEAALAALNGLAAGLPLSEAEASARYVLAERTGGTTDASIQAFASYAAAYARAVAASASKLLGAYPSAEAYLADALARQGVSETAYERAYGAMYDALHAAYLSSDASEGSAAETAQSVATPAIEAAAALFAEHVLGDAAFLARLDAYAASVAGRAFIAGVGEDGRAGDAIVANIGRVFVREEATAVLAGLSLDLVEAYDTATILMLGGSAEKVTTGHAASLYTEGVRITRIFALNGSTQAHTGSEIGAAFADPGATVLGPGRVQKQFHLLGN